MSSNAIDVYVGVFIGFVLTQAAIFLGMWMQNQRIERRNFSRHDERYTPEQEDSSK